MADTKPEIEVVYLGEYPVKGGGRGHAFIPLEVYNAEAKQSDLLVMAALWKDRRSFTMGGHYVGKGTIEEGRIKSLGLKLLRFRGSVPKADWFLLQEAEAHAEALKARAATLEKKAMANVGIMGEVKALGALYAQTRFSDRCALELTILNLIRRAGI